MLNIPDGVKELYKQDSVRKNFRVVFPNEEMNDLTNKDIITESVSFSESISSNEYLKFGTSEVPVIEFETIGVDNMMGYNIICFTEIDVTSISDQSSFTDTYEILGREYPAYVALANSDIGYPFYRIPLGVFRVESCPRNHENMVRRMVSAYGVTIEKKTQMSFGFQKYFTAKWHNDSALEIPMFLVEREIVPEILSDKGEEGSIYWSGREIPPTRTDSMNETDPYRRNGTAITVKDINGTSRTIRIDFFVDQRGYDRRLTPYYGEATYYCWSGIVVPQNVYLREELLNDALETILEIGFDDSTTKTIKDYFENNGHVFLEEYAMPCDYTHYNDGDTGYEWFQGAFNSSCKALYDSKKTTISDGDQFNVLAYVDYHGPSTTTWNFYAYYNYVVPIIVNCTGINPITLEETSGKSFRISEFYVTEWDRPTSNLLYFKRSNKVTSRRQKFYYNYDTGRCGGFSNITRDEYYATIPKKSEILNGYAEINGSFLAQKRLGNRELLSINSPSNAIDVSNDIIENMWWDEYDISPIGEIRYTFYASGSDSDVEGVYHFGEGNSIYEMNDNFYLKNMKGLTPSIVTSLLNEKFIPKTNGIYFSQIDLIGRALPYVEPSDYLYMSNYPSNMHNKNVMWGIDALCGKMYPISSASQTITGDEEGRIDVIRTSVKPNTQYLLSGSIAVAVDSTVSAGDSLLLSTILYYEDQPVMVWHSLKPIAAKDIGTTVYVSPAFSEFSTGDREYLDIAILFGFSRHASQSASVLVYAYRFELNPVELEGTWSNKSFEATSAGEYPYGIRQLISGQKRIRVVAQYGSEAELVFKRIPIQLFKDYTYSATITMGALAVTELSAGVSFAVNMTIIDSDTSETLGSTSITDSFNSVSDAQKTRIISGQFSSEREEYVDVILSTDLSNAEGLTVGFHAYNFILSEGTEVIDYSPYEGDRDFVDKRFDIISPVLRRTMSGIQSLMDSIESSGGEIIGTGDTTWEEE